MQKKIIDDLFHKVTDYAAKQSRQFLREKRILSLLETKKGIKKLLTQKKFN